MKRRPEFRAPLYFHRNTQTMFDLLAVPPDRIDAIRALGD